MDKKVSISKLDNLLNGSKKDRIDTVEFDVAGEKIGIAVKTYLLPHEEYSCVQSIVSSVFIGGEYAPEVLESSAIMNFFAYYTNIKIEAGMDRIYALWYGCPGTRERLIGAINCGQWTKIMNAVNQAVDYRLKMEVSEQAMRMDALVQEVEASTTVLKTFSDTFSGISADELNAAVSKLAGMDESKIIDFVAAAQKKTED